jgi:hypothetical protein
MCAMLGLGPPCAMLKCSNKGLGFKWSRVFLYDEMRCAIMGSMENGEPKLHGLGFKWFRVFSTMRYAIMG